MYAAALSLTTHLFIKLCPGNLLNRSTKVPLGKTSYLYSYTVSYIHLYKKTSVFITFDIIGQKMTESIAVA
jgi:hypothetical protein